MSQQPSPEQPPRTSRPNHRVVGALAEGTFVELMFETLAPGDWWYETEGGFSWIPHRLRHDIEQLIYEDDDGGSTTVCRSTFLLCTDVTDLFEALGTCHYLNQRTTGAAVWLDLDERCIYATSSVALDPATWFTAALFYMTVPRQVGVFESFAPRLAAVVGGRVPDAQHPTLGRRSSPDQFLAETKLITRPPEAGAGLWWSRRELEMFRRTLRFMIEGTDRPSVADTIDPEIYDDELTAAANFTEEFVFGPADEWVSVVTQEGRHPDFGYGLEILLSTVYSVGERPVLDGPPTSGLDAMVAANQLNVLAHRWPTRFHMGAWTTWRNQLHYATFLMPEPLATLQNLAAPNAGEVMGLLAFRTMDHVEMLRGVRDHGLFEQPPHLCTERLWNGVADNAGHESLLVDADAVFAPLLQAYPLNTLLDPVELDDDAYHLQTTTSFVTMGIFNPSGPSVGSLELAINYRLGRALLIERLRHFLSPRVTLHAVVDLDGYLNIEPILEEVVARLEWATFDWWDMRQAPEETMEAMRRGLRRFAEASDEDLGVRAMKLMETRDNPWTRLTRGYEPASEWEDDVDPIDVWIDVITHPANIDNHVAHIRSAWEGAVAFVQVDDNGAAAQRAADNVTANVRLRKAPGR